ncbi:antitoxin (DNA-binding transcriptional repressor) of toxin-antitoxin stability system [Sinorhizobium terangae]|nr:hypothetical protein [Sinorhizobium terangae]MBB4184775.1 antitoxin (DNA-binding transcriptional repressor) of toxin-antitoxin stability system [Sinorhizobium terangae]
MKILIEVDEAAERLEELIDLASQRDVIYVCRGGRPVAQLSAFSGTKDDPRSDEFAGTFPETGPTAPGGKLFEGGKVSSVDQVWMLAAEGKPGWERDMTSAHDDLSDEDALPR